MDVAEPVGLVGVSLPGQGRLVRLSEEVVVAFGVNAISVYVLAGIVARLLIHTQVQAGDETVAMKRWLFDGFFAPWAPPYLASLAFALAFLAVMWALVELLYQRRIFIKV